jgi:transcriptional regulator with XRE-family HTH domain
METKSDLLKQRFSKELRRCCGSYYPKFPSNEQFARDLHHTSKYALRVSRETVRKWLTGQSFPDLNHLVHLIEWLGLDMTNVFGNGRQDGPDNVEASRSKHLPVSSIAGEDITPAQFDVFIRFLKSIEEIRLEELQLLSRNKER